jgi:hypothetical protein
MIGYGKWAPWVDATLARDHVQVRLRKARIGWRRAADLAGVPRSTMIRLLFGGPDGRPPSRYIRPETSAAILAVDVAPASIAPGAHVDGTGTRRRLRALVEKGHSQTALAERLRKAPSSLGRIIRGTGLVCAATERAVRELYDQLWDQEPAAATPRDKGAVTQARHIAEGLGWAPPLAWDDHSDDGHGIDDPQAAPSPWKRGGPHRSAELAADADELLRYGCDRAEAAARLEVTVAALDKARARAAHHEEQAA